MTNTTETQRKVVSIDSVPSNAFKKLKIEELDKKERTLQAKEEALDARIQEENAKIIAKEEALNLKEKKQLVMHFLLFVVVVSTLSADWNNLDLFAKTIFFLYLGALFFINGFWMLFLLGVVGGIIFLIFQQ